MQWVKTEKVRGKEKTFPQPTDQPRKTLLIQRSSLFLQLLLLLLLFKMAYTKETTLERAAFALQLLIFVTAEKEGQMFIIIFLSIFFSAVVPAVFSKDKQRASRP